MGIKTLLIALAISTTAVAVQDPPPSPVDPVSGELTLPRLSDPHTLVLVTVANTDATGASCAVIGKQTFSPVQVVSTVPTLGNTRQWAWTGPPDEYIVTVNLVRDGSIRTIQQKCIIGKAPNPPPDEDDEPDPTKTLARVVIVEESGERTPQQSAMYVQIRGWEAAPVPTLIVDQDGNSEYADKVENVPGCLLVFDDGSTEERELPADFDAFKAMVAEYE